ncbi:MAG: hypothetical protein ACI9SJ_002422 [Flavobacteriaceae bacterium]|jgi:hypothetical protein|uniref:hypothetical protein n=1 Tax=Candidatus Marifrigoribacter sp. Uisw_064 TaxID=3230970 RepID=UPI003AEB265F
MELANIESLLEDYFEGNTTLEQETILRTYFANEEVADHLAPYKNLFAGLSVAKQEVSQRALKLPETTGNTRGMWYSIAASAAIVIVVAGFMFSSPGISQGEKDALMALNKTKETMLLFSDNLNKGTEPMFLLSENFTKGTDALLAINEITLTAEKLLK